MMYAVVLAWIGFIGHVLLEDLHARYGDRVKLYSSSRSQRYPSEHWTWIPCDLTSVDSLRAVLEKTGAQTVFLAAASHFESSREDAYAINVLGVQALLRAAQQSGVRRFVLTSSTAVTYTGADLIDAREDAPYPANDDDYPSYYGCSKARGEQLVLEANGVQGMYTAAIRPCGTIGAGDVTVVPQGIKVLKDGQGWIQIGDNKNKADFDHVSNVTYGHILACEKLLDPHDPNRPGPAAGQAFNITCGEPVEMFTFWRKCYKEYCNYQPWFTLVIPYFLAWILAVINEFASWTVGKKATGLTRYTLVYATSWRTHSIEKARKLLGYEPVVGLDEGIRLAVRAYKEDEEKARLAAAAKKGR